MRNLYAEPKHIQSLAARLMGCSPEDVTDIETLKLGMTNHSYLFAYHGGRFILRVAGEGTDKLIDREQEAAVYAVLAGLDICDEVVAIEPSSGCKISRFYENARVCDPLNEADLRACLAKLKAFHDRELAVEHSFDIFGQIEFYESLWEGKPSCYADYAETKTKVMALREGLDCADVKQVLTHIDANPDNFLFIGDGEIRLIDWEYAGMQDPYVDVAMFGIYAMYDRERMERLIDLYFDGACPAKARARIYAYIAACGLLWSNWCEYKYQLGVDFGDYARVQYDYARDYAQMALKAMEAADEKGGEA